jgi:hypothetical protein
MRTTRFMVLAGLIVYFLACTAMAQSKKAAPQPGSKQADSAKEDITGKSEDPFSAAPQGDPNGLPGSAGGNTTLSRPRPVVINGETLQPSRVFSFQVNIESLTIVAGQLPQLAGSSAMGGYGDMMGESGGEGYAGMDGGYGDMGGMSMGMGGSGMGAGMAMRAPNPNVVHLAAYVFDDEKRDGRTRIEVGTTTPPSKKGGAVVNPLEKLQLPQGKAKPKLAFTPASAKLVENAIRLQIWKKDSIAEFKATGGQGDQATEAEQLLKAILTEEYEGQIKRQEFQLARLKSQLAKIQEEITRRQGAKDRVIDVQLGKILLEAQGIIGAGEQ